MMTGMGDDGTILNERAFFDNGAYTIAQNDSYLCCFGMPIESNTNRSK